MLATTWDKERAKVRFPLLAQAKLDGIRGVYWEGAFLSRTLKPIATASAIRAELARATAFPFPLDGELFVHGRGFSDVVRAVHADDAALEYVVYDCMAPASSAGGLGFGDREALLRAWFHKNARVLKRVRLLGSRVVAGAADVEAAHADFVAQKYEGVMLRAPAALYEHGRSHSLIKLKAFRDAEFEVVGFRRLPAAPSCGSAARGRRGARSLQHPRARTRTRRQR